MQQSIYSHIAIQPANQSTKMTGATATGSRRTSLVRRIMQKWDLCGLLALMASSAAYGLYAIGHAL